MLEKYYKYKLDYRYYIILIKCGNFYESIDNDAFIMNKIFNYKLKKLSNTFKVGFPVNSIDNIVNTLEKNNINYIIVDNDVISEKSFRKNTYTKYNFDDKNIFYNSLRVEKITGYLNDNITTKDFDKKLEEIERIIYD